MRIGVMVFLMREVADFGGLKGTDVREKGLDLSLITEMPFI